MFIGQGIKWRRLTPAKVVHATEWLEVGFQQQLFLTFD
jgi:hypothetical protein